MIVGKINPLFYSSDKINFAEPRNRLTNATEEYSLGGIELEDTSQGLKSNIWVSYLGSDNNIFIKRIDREESSVVFEFPDIDWLSFTFDQNMRPIHSFMSKGKSYIRFYSGTQFEIKELIGARFPNIILDLYEKEDIPKYIDLIRRFNQNQTDNGFNAKENLFFYYPFNEKSSSKKIILLQKKQNNYDKIYFMS